MVNENQDEIITLCKSKIKIEKYLEKNQKKIQLKPIPRFATLEFQRMG